MSTMMKALRFVGDLDDDFYKDERQRDVWNEASAVGFQLAYWIALIAAAILPWVAGRTGAWISFGLIIGWFVCSMVVLRYAQAHDVDVYASMRVRAPSSRCRVRLRDRTDRRRRTTDGSAGRGNRNLGRPWSRCAHRTHCCRPGRQAPPEARRPTRRGGRATLSAHLF